MKQKVPRELPEIVLELAIDSQKHRTFPPKGEAINNIKVFIVFFVETVPGRSTKIKSDVMKSNTLAIYGRSFYCVLKFLLFHTNIRRGSYNNRLLQQLQNA